ncbi:MULTISPECIES: hypothetical protein [Bacillaceae]|uniref:hypothetical protein n=1 Tax=Bacillaceae TaxID=186817 RepID=UPI001A903F57|nr:hypothetical protein [Bacillus sp. NTK034]MBN8202022.1 hypothetical protein [Bacillus sp. NTK034]
MGRRVQPEKHRFTGREIDATNHLSAGIRIFTAKIINLTAKRINRRTEQTFTGQISRNTGQTE